MRFAAFALMVIAMPAPLLAQDSAPQAGVDFAGFVELASELQAYRATRLLPYARFAEQARAQGAVLLDARSTEAFAAGHIDGAINLPFSEFTAEKLAAVLGNDFDRPIYIYCNNNFADNVPPVRLKRLELALNIPTFINLYGYGYRNIWELGDVVTMAEVDWVGS